MTKKSKQKLKPEQLEFLFSLQKAYNQLKKKKKKK